MRYSELLEAELYCRRLQEEGAGVLFWEWDERNNAAHAVFTEKELKQVQKVMAADFRLLCSASGLRKKPELAALAQLLGGLSGDQLLFGAGVEDSVVLLAAWWPWMDQETFSLRLRLPVAAEQPESREAFRSFRSWFGFD